MKVIIDCGSTKCNFLFVDNKQIQQCKGFNPNISDDIILKENITSNPKLFSAMQKVESITFYGTGCAKDTNRERVKSVLSELFPQASITVKHDLDLTLEALAKNEACFVNILGTGSNSLFFDGTKPIQLVPSLGYILGDEGSGVWFGKQLLRDYFYKKLPQEIYKAIHQKESPTLDETLKRVYRTDGANRYIANYTRYLSEFIHTEYVQKLLHKGFNSFLKAFVLDSNKLEYPLHFSGSISFYFAEELKNVLKENKLICGTIVKSPLDTFN